MSLSDPLTPRFALMGFWRDVADFKEIFGDFRDRILVLYPTEEPQAKLHDTKRKNETLVRVRGADPR